MYWAVSLPVSCCSRVYSLTVSKTRVHPGVVVGFVLLDLSFSVLYFVDYCLSFLSFFSWPLHCSLITLLVSSNCS
jgi:hypothetical protein